ncbi:tolloid-like protein 2 isoform X1 [Oculina patagonica]
MFSVRQLVFTVFTGFLFCGRQYAYGDCNGLTTYIDSTQNGSINLDNNRYSNQSCTWVITAPIGQRVLIYFTRFNLRNCHNCNYCSSVTIIDGSFTWSPRLAKYCGSDLPRPVYSSGNRIWITFWPLLSYETYEAFTLQFSTLFLHSSGCPSIVPGASAGVIYSPNFPRNYPNISCDWFIRVPYGEKININFSYILPYGDCKALVKIYDTYSHLKRRVTLCTNPFPFTYSESIHVRYNARFTSTSFLVFYQIGYYVPTYAPPWYTTQSYPDCQSNSKKTIYIQSSGSTSVSSSAGRAERYTVPPHTACLWQIATTEGYTLELTFDDMNIYSKYSCSDCSCGYVRVRDGSGSSAQSLGTFCDGNIPSVVSSTGNHIFIEFHSQRRYDYFKASIYSKETKAHHIPGIVVPIVLGIVLFAIIVTVIKCTKITRSTASTRQEGSCQVPLPLERIEFPLNDEEMIDF